MKNKTACRASAFLLAGALLFVSGALNANAAELPVRYSSKIEGYVTDVKLQRHNDCWGYASLAAFESKLLRSGIETGDMSVDLLNLWATTRTNGKGWQRNADSDGYAEIALGYLTSWQGAIEQSVAGDIDLSGALNGDSAMTSPVRYGVTEVEYLSRNDMESIKRAITEHGGVYASFATTPSCLSLDMTSYYMPESYSGPCTGHAVEIIGWNDRYSPAKFNGSINSKPSQLGAWLAKNSSGNYNSLGGYFWISYYDKNIFGEKYKPSYAITGVEELNENISVLQNEIYGATYEFGYVNRDEISYINRFDFSKDFKTLDKLVFESTAKGADYTISYIPCDKSGAPVSDKGKWQKLYSDKIPYSGYICADLPDISLPEGKGAIAVTVNTKNADSVKNSIGVGEWLRNTQQGVYKFLNDSKRGDSYIMYDNKMLDLLDWYEQENSDPLGGTFVIKAITTKSKEQPPILGDTNLDGKLDISDATLIQKHLAGMAKLSERALQNADVDNNGSISISDVTALQKRLAGLI